MGRDEPREHIDDETIIKNIDEWQISVSKSKRLLYIDTTSYHPFKLGLSREYLQELLERMDDILKK